ncbi:hypothetical protein NUW58_g10497 [Xylaria curta]|uniref:Uncharacterized protein n=1 Tax=Xylaria curta TaxID=42375 RepID=A0ACC1MKT9_9PEZI|nr:hypothetical protein NUW58_g10497 [Xylaria curta]
MIAVIDRLRAVDQLMNTVRLVDVTTILTDETIHLPIRMSTVVPTIGLRETSPHERVGMAHVKVVCILARIIGEEATDIQPITKLGMK